MKNKKKIEPDKDGIIWLTGSEGAIDATFTEWHEPVKKPTLVIEVSKTEGWNDFSSPIKTVELVDKACVIILENDYEMRTNAFDGCVQHFNQIGSVEVNFTL